MSKIQTTDLEQHFYDSVFLEAFRKDNTGNIHSIERGASMVAKAALESRRAALIEPELV